MSDYHRPIMLQEVVEGLNVANANNGIFFDGTLGGSGHSRAILEANPTVKLIATDKDGDAIEEAARKLAPFQGRYKVVRTDFKQFEKVLDSANVEKIDGFLLDLGMSSHQIDDEGRGFAYFKPNAPLDMRMDKRKFLTAADVVNGYSEDALKQILFGYGEEEYAGSIARGIVKAREREPISTCGRLREIIEANVPARYRYNACARKTFQAIRIEVNGELDGLSECVTAMVRRLKPGGRGCVLTFHSLEDRLVKRAFQDLCSGCVCPKTFPVCVCGKKEEAKLITRHPLVASEEEMTLNTRSKSAKLRIIEKL